MNTQTDKELAVALKNKISDIDAELAGLYDVVQRIDGLREQRDYVLSVLATLDIDPKSTHGGNGANADILDVSDLSFRNACVAVIDHHPSKSLTARELRIGLLEAGWKTKSKKPDNLVRVWMLRLIEDGLVKKTKKGGKVAYGLP